VAYKSFAVVSFGVMAGSMGFMVVHVYRSRHQRVDIENEHPEAAAVVAARKQAVADKETAERRERLERALPQIVGDSPTKQRNTGAEPAMPNTSFRLRQASPTSNTSD